MKNKIPKSKKQIPTVQQLEFVFKGAVLCRFRKTKAVFEF
jgi:hypothetical protein